MTDQADAANRWAREALGSQVDAGKHLGVVKGGDEDPGGGVPWVRLPSEGYQLSAFAKEVGAVLAADSVFRRETIPVTINEESGRMDMMTADRFRSYVEKSMVPYRWKYRGKDDPPDKVPVTMSKEVATGCLASDDFIWQQRRIEKVNTVRLPVEREDGRIELLPNGYDEESRTFTMTSEIEIDESMTLDTAKCCIEDLLNEFPFGDVGEDGNSRSRAVVVSSMLGMFASGLQPINAKRMNFVFTANSQRSGKTLLAQICLVPTCGICLVNPLPDSAEELRKVLETEALNASPYILFDNISGVLKNDALEAFLTASYWSGRVMNSQKKFTAPKLSTVFLTGNNLTVSTDMAGRVLICELYVEEASPQDREITRVIDEQYLARPEVRRDILSALWAHVRAWDEAGRPPGGRVMRGYEDWSRIFGGIVMHAGWGDPIATPSTENAGDTDMQDMVAVMLELVKDMGEDKVKEFTFDELIDCCREIDAFSWMISGKMQRDGKDGPDYFEPAPKTRSSMGKLWAGKYGGRIFRLSDGRRAKFGARGRNRQRRYRIEIVG